MRAIFVPAFSPLSIRVAASRIAVLSDTSSGLAFAVLAQLDNISIHANIILRGFCEAKTSTKALRQRHPCRSITQNAKMIFFIVCSPSKYI
jgi:hypothetical protein